MGNGFVFLEFLLECSNEAGEIRFILEVLVNTIDVVIVPDGSEEADLSRSEIFHENGVDLFPQHFLNVLN